MFRREMLAGRFAFFLNLSTIAFLCMALVCPMRAFTDNALHDRTLKSRDPSVTPGGSSGGAGVATAIAGA